jgi:hypothetical protein
LNRSPPAPAKSSYYYPCSRESDYSMHQRTLLPLVVALTVIFPAMAWSAAPGDLLVSTATSGPGFTHGFVGSYSDNGIFIGPFANVTGAPDTLADDLRGHIDLTFSDAPIAVFSVAGTPTGTFGAPGAGVTFGANGHAYLAAPPGILEYDATGTFVRSFSLSAQPYDVDLDADQCTIFYTVLFANRIGRFDVCSDIALSDLSAILPGTDARRLRLLSDGSVLVANNEVIARVSRTGVVLQTYAISGTSGWLSLALTTDRQAFWAGSHQNVSKFQLATGAALPPVIPAGDPTSLLVVGEPRLAAVASPTVPTVSRVGILALTLALMAAAFARVRMS